MAIEDAAVLGNLLSRLSHTSQIKYLVSAYQHLRLARTTEMQRSSRLNQYIFHLPDGPAQRERDELMKAAMEAELSGNTTELASGSPNQWADKEKNMALFGYDADLEADKWWREYGEREIGGLADMGLSKL